MKRLILLAACLAIAISSYAATTHYIYVAGGRAPSGTEPGLDATLDATVNDIDIRSVLVADVDVSAKTVTNWRRAGILPTSHPVDGGNMEWSYIHDAVNYYNGRIYVGPAEWNTAAPTADYVAYADVFYGGQLGSFNSSPIFPTTGSTDQGISATAIHEISGQAYYYVLGGNHTEAGASARVLYAPIDGTTGAIGAWQISTTPIPVGDWFNSAISDAGNLIHSSGNLRGSMSVDHVTPSGTGDITSAWTSNVYSALATNRWDHVMLKATSGGNTFAYLVGGTTGTTLDRVDFAQLTAGVPGTWGTTNVIPAVRRRLAGASVEDMLIIPGGSTTTSFAFGTKTVFIGSVASDGSISWTTSPNEMLHSRTFHGAAIAELPPAPLSANGTWSLYE